MTGHPQFNVLVSCLVLGACRARPASGYRANTSQQRQNIEQMQQQLWSYYQQLKTYPQTPTADRKRELEQTFDQLFGRCFLHHASLNTVCTAIQPPPARPFARGARRPCSVPNKRTPIPNYRKITLAPKPRGPARPPTRPASPSCGGQVEKSRCWWCPFFSFLFFSFCPESTHPPSPR